MTTLPTPTLEAPPISPVAQGRGPFRYSLERYHAAIAAGILTENDEVELIFGEIIEKLPIGKRHADCIDVLVDAFAPKFLKTHRLRVQNPVTLLGNSEPEPDFVLVNRQTYAQRKGKPLAEDIALLIEVSDATLDYDRVVKLKMYALAGIQEYWIINLKQDQIEVHLSPVITSGDYNNIQRHARGSIFESPFCGSIVVDELLPPTDQTVEEN